MAESDFAHEVRDCRAEAKAAGIPWQWVVDLKNDLVRLEAEAREAPDAVRREAWAKTCRRMGWAASREVWWRVGFQRCFPRITEKCELDFTSIPCYDLIAKSIVEELGAYQFDGDHPGDVSGTEALWDFLLNEPYQPWPPRIDFYWRALNEIIERRTRCAVAEVCEEVPF